MSKTVHDQAMEERKFLHDLSNQLVVAHGMGSFVLKQFEKREDETDPKEFERLKKSITAVEKMIDLIKERRSILYELTGEGS